MFVQGRGIEKTLLSDVGTCTKTDGCIYERGGTLQRFNAEIAFSESDTIKEMAYSQHHSQLSPLSMDCFLGIIVLSLYLRRFLECYRPMHSTQLLSWSQGLL